LECATDIVGSRLIGDLGVKLSRLQARIQARAIYRKVKPPAIGHNLKANTLPVKRGDAKLALWLRCQRAYPEMGLKQDRPKITESHIVCAQPMPGENKMLEQLIVDFSFTGFAIGRTVF
jgi:hypothetical protein